MKVIRALYCLAFLGGGFSSHASMFDDEIPASATQVPFDFATPCIIGTHKFVFESTTLADVIRALGGGVIRWDGKPGASVFDYFVDYIDGSHRIRFSSNNDMGGNDHGLEGVEITPLSLSGEGKAREPFLLKLPITFLFGPADISLSSLKQRFGPAANHKGRIDYEYAGKKPIKDFSGKSNICDVTASLEIRVINGRIIALSVWHVTSL